MLTYFVWQELTEVDTLNENEDGAEGLIDSLLEGQITALLIQNIERLDESVKEEADGVYNSLGIKYYLMLWLIEISWLR